MKESTRSGYQSVSVLNITKNKDEGWGWAVVFGSFMLHWLSTGILLCFGIFITDFVIYFNSTKGIASTIISLMSGCSNLVGPIAGSLTNRYGCRMISLCGSIIGCLGILISIPVTNILYLFITLGFFTGFGIGLMVIPSVIIVNAYFEKKRAFAIGLATCGGGIGTFIQAPFLYNILKFYGSWRGAFFIISGLFLNGCVFASLFRPIETRIITLPRKKIDDLITVIDPLPEIREKASLPRNSEYYIQISRSDSDIFDKRKNLGNKSFRKTYSDSDLRYESIDIYEYACKKNSLFSPSISFTCYVTNRENNHNESVDTFPKIPSKTLNEVLQQSKIVTSKSSGLMYRKDILYSGNLKKIPEYRSLTPEVYKAVVSTIIIEPETKKRKWISTEITLILNEMFKISLLKESAFRILLLVRLISTLGLQVPFFYMNDRLVGLNIQNASYIISIMGICNSIGRIILGLISDTKRITSVMLYLICMISCGVAIIISCLCTTFATMVVFSVVFGITSGLGIRLMVIPSVIIVNAYFEKKRAFAIGLATCGSGRPNGGVVCMTSLVIVELMGIAKFTNAYCLLMLFNSITLMTGPPITGFLYDLTGSYDYGFILSGGLVTLSGLLCFSLRSFTVNKIETVSVIPSEWLGLSSTVIRGK